ncbi:MAG: carboxymuconolactone decarboxylase family protein [Gemmatimonadaceae bacterium]
MARRLGAKDEQVAALARGDLSSFSPAWASALAYAAHMTPTGATVSGDAYRVLATHWDSPQIVEITAVAALFNYFNRFAIALEVPVTR